MAKPEIPSEVPSRRRKRELSEDNIINESIESEGAVNNDSEESEDDIINDSKESEGDIINDSDDSDESDYFTDYDSDDPAFEILEGKADRKIWKQYHKERIESEGFDISVHPGTSFMAGIAQQNGHLVNPKIKEEYTELCKLAIHDFNSKNDKMYEFEEIVNVNASSAAGTWYYFTFKARDTTADAIKTFQALVWHGIDRTIDVSFCRLKKFLTEEDKKKMRKERKKTRREAFKKAEQDKPSLVKCFAPGLVIEELCKGKAGGKKAYPGYKVGIRYTAKLKENDKIFDTNIGKGDPLEFRIASAQLIPGWEMGVDGMRVGDKRRITIPPDLGYGAKGYLDVVLPDSWLVIEVELIYIS